MRPANQRKFSKAPGIRPCKSRLNFTKMCDSYNPALLAQAYNRTTSACQSERVFSPRPPMDGKENADE